MVGFRQRGGFVLEASGGSNPALTTYPDWVITPATAFKTFGTYLASAPKAISGITRAATTTITCVAHGKAPGDTIYIAGPGGTTELNGWTGLVLATPTADTLTIAVNSTGYTAYSNGGWILPGSTPGWYVVSGGTGSLVSGNVQITPSTLSSTVVLAYYTGENLSALTSIVPTFTVATRDNIASMQWYLASGTNYNSNYVSKKFLSAGVQGYGVVTGHNCQELPIANFNVTGGTYDPTYARAIAVAVQFQTAISTVTFSDLSKNQVSQPVAVIEFDDFNARDYTDYFPVIKQVAQSRRVHCAMNLAAITQNIGGANRLTLAQIQEMLDSGYVDLIAQADADGFVANGKTQPQLETEYGNMFTAITSTIKRKAPTSMLMNGGQMGANQSDHDTIVVPAMQTHKIKKAYYFGAMSSGATGIISHKAQGGRYEGRVLSLQETGTAATSCDSVPIVSIANGTPGIFYCPAHPFTNNENVVVVGLVAAGVSGITDDYEFNLTVVDADHVHVNTTTSGTYTGGATVQSVNYYRAGQVAAWRAKGHFYGHGTVTNNVPAATLRKFLNRLIDLGVVICTEEEYIAGLNWLRTV